MPFPSISVPFFVPAFYLNRNGSGLKFLRWVGGPILSWELCLSTGTVSLQVLSALCLVFRLMSSPVDPGFL